MRRLPAARDFAECRGRYHVSAPVYGPAELGRYAPTLTNVWVSSQGCELGRSPSLLALSLLRESSIIKDSFQFAPTNTYEFCKRVTGLP